MSNKKDTEQQEELLQEDGQPQESKEQGEKSDGQVNTEESENLEDALQKEKDKFLRLFAEFENYKKRTARERMDLYKTAGQEVITAMLPILDDFDRALRELERSEDDELSKGVVLIHNKFRDALMSKGLEPIEVSIGDAFDPEVH
ncbi:MAG: nucleotide exchange factor GrpE, partial [Robiginitalea sp.]